MKLRAAQPAALEARPEQNCVHLPRELINPPDTVVLYDFTRPVEWQAVQPAKGIDLVPVLANVPVFQGNVVRPIGAPARSTAARKKHCRGIANPGTSAMVLPIRRGSSDNSLPAPKP